MDLSQNRPAWVKGSMSEAVRRDGRGQVRPGEAALSSQQVARERPAARTLWTGTVRAAMLPDEGQLEVAARTRAIALTGDAAADCTEAAATGRSRATGMDAFCKFRPF
jgi:hypothetical protein